MERILGSTELVGIVGKLQKCNGRDRKLSAQKRSADNARNNQEDNSGRYSTADERHLTGQTQSDLSKPGSRDKKEGEEVIEKSQNNSENSKVTEEMLLTNILRMVTIDYLQGIPIVGYIEKGTIYYYSLDDHLEFYSKHPFCCPCNHCDKVRAVDVRFKPNS